MVISNFSFSQEENVQQDQQTALGSIQILIDDDKMSPIEKAERLNTLASVSKDNNWNEALLRARVFQIKSLVESDNIGRAKSLWPDTFDLAKTSSNLEYLVRLELASLYFNFPFNGTQTVLDKHKEILELAKQIEGPNVLADIYEGLGNSNHDDYSYVDALQYLQKAYDYYEAVNDKASMGSVLSGLGSIYSDLGNTDMALDYFNRSIILAEQSGNRFFLSVVYFNMGEAYYVAGDYDKALENSIRALNLSQELGDKIGIAWSQATLADLYLLREEWSRAIELYEQAAEVFENSSDNQMLFNTRVGLVSGYLKKGKIDIAARYLEEAEQLRSQFSSITANSWLYSAREQYYFAIGDYEKAYEALALYVDELEKEHKTLQQDQIQKYRIQFDAQLKETQNIALEKEIELNNLKLEQQQKLQWLWLALLILSVTVVIVVVILLFRQVNSRNQFRDMALLDHLTDAPNRRAILLRAKMLFKRAVAQHSNLTICLIDLDHFKSINDNFGHEVGDEVLIAFAKACESSLRTRDNFGRYGGEEWLLVLEKLPEDEVVNIFNRIKAWVNQIDIEGLPSDVRITFSMGCAQFDAKRDKDIKQLIKRADSMLYKAKQNGRDQFFVD